MIRLSRDQVRQIDSRAFEQYKLPGIVLMENAARAVVDIASILLRGDYVGQILILCGGGNNGGDGLAVARHLHNRGANVHVVTTTDPSKYQNEARINWDIVSAMEIEKMDLHSDWERLQPVLIIDAIFGTGLTQPPREPFDHIAHVVARMRAPVLAIDIPSGMDCDTGRPLGGSCIAAHRTVTFVAEKTGFAQPDARQWLGQVTVADIGCPIELIDMVAGKCLLPPYRYSQNMASP